jgi:hypothetical protein
VEAGRQAGAGERAPGALRLQLPPRRRTGSDGALDEHGSTLKEFGMSDEEDAVADMIAHYTRVLRAMPAAETEPGAVDELVHEIRALSPGRRRATALMPTGDAFIDAYFTPELISPGE